MSVSDARWRAETVRAGSLMEAFRGHYRGAAGDRETVRAAPMAKVQRLAEMISPAADEAASNNYCAWPVIDATFRYSIFLLGTLVAHAPSMN